MFVEYAAAKATTHSILDTKQWRKPMQHDAAYKGYTRIACIYIEAKEGEGI